MDTFFCGPVLSFRAAQIVGCSVFRRLIGATPVHRIQSGLYESLDRMPFRGGLIGQSREELSLQLMPSQTPFQALGCASAWTGEAELWTMFLWNGCGVKKNTKIGHLHQRLRHRPNSDQWAGSLLQLSQRRENPSKPGLSNTLRSAFRLNPQPQRPGDLWTRCEVGWATLNLGALFGRDGAVVGLSLLATLLPAMLLALRGTIG